MFLDVQLKVFFFSFIYGIFVYFFYRNILLLKTKKYMVKFSLNFFCCMLIVFLFYFLLYKINYGELNYYIFILFAIGCYFCHLLYYKDK